MAADGAAFFERDASQDRKRVLRENLAALPASSTMGQAFFAQTPMRFFDPRFDATPLFAGSAANPGFFGHLLGALTAGWDVTSDPGSLRVPLFIGLGRHDYVTPWSSWSGISEGLPDATVEVFERSGHQPFFEEPDRFASALAEWMAGARR